MYVNGAGILQQDGIDLPSRKMYMNKISRGAIARNYQHFAELSYYSGDLMMDWDFKPQVGRQAYLTVGVEDLIRNLDIDVRRDYDTGDNDFYSGCTAHIFGRVARSFVLKDNVVLTSY